MWDLTTQRWRSRPDRRRGGARLVGLALIVAPLAFLLLFYAYPLVEIARISLRDLTHFGEASVAARLTSPYTLRVIAFTFGQALLSTLLTLVLALPGAYVLARYRFPGKPVVRALVTVPFVLPTVVVAAALNAVLGPTSLLNRWLGLDLRYTLGAILIAHVFYNYAVVVRVVGGFWSTMERRLEEAARTLGASPWIVFWRITLPLLLPVVTTAALLVFVFCFTSFGAVLILGGPRFATLEVEIYRQTINFANLPVAAALSFLQAAFTLVLTAIYARLQRRVGRPVEQQPEWTVRGRPRTVPEIGLIIANAVVITLLVALPLVTLVWRSLASGLTYYAALIETPRQSVFYVPPLVAVRNSISIAVLVTALALALGLLTSLGLLRRRGGWLVDALFMLPLGTSAVTLGLGYLLAMDTPPLELRGTVALIVFAHTLVALPFVVRNVLPALQAIQPQLREAAALLGASPLRTLREVDLPMAWRGLVVGAVFAFTVSMGEFGATSMIARPSLPTIPIGIYRFLSRPGALNYGQALAMSTILMGVCVVGFYAIERLQPPGLRSF